MMRVNWVYADSCQLDPIVDIEQIKSVGPSWGSWKTWRGCATDNIICHDLAKARELLARSGNFQSKANFYVPKKHYQDLSRPMGIKLYDGDFGQDLDRVEDIVSMHLASANSDIVLLLGFSCESILLPEDPYAKHKIKNYHGLLRSVIKNNPTVQWVLVDHPNELDIAYQKLPNLTCDSMQSVLQLLL